MTAQASFDLTGSFANVYSEPGDRHLRVGDGEVGFHHSDPVDTELGSALAQVHTSGDKKRRLLRALVDARWRGLTDHEAVAKTGMQMSSVNSTRNMLVERGLVKGSDYRRLSPFGQKTIVWTATDKGRRAVK